MIQKGTDITLIGYGGILRTIKDAADMASEKGFNCEIIDLQTILPYDLKTLVESVNKTGRCIIVHEAPKTCGMGVIFYQKI